MVAVPVLDESIVNPRVHEHDGGNLKTGMILAAPTDEIYAELCEFTERQFERRFSSHLEHFYPLILSSWQEGELQAVVGFRRAAAEPLFLEQYLAQPLDELLDTTRERIVEIGGFAALNRAAALPLMRAAASQLQSLRLQIAACTANAPIRGCLKRLGIDYKDLGEANPKAIKGSTEDWGSYYRSSPRVIAGNIEAGVEAMNRLFAGF